MSARLATSAMLAALTLALVGCGGAAGAPSPSPSATPPGAATAQSSAAATAAPTRVAVVVATPAPAATSPAPSSSPPSRASSSPASVAASAAPSSSQPAASATSISITKSDFGKTFNVTVGTTVLLAYETDGLSWSNVFDTAVLKTVNATTLQAIGKGQTTIQSQGRAVCNPGQACPQFIVAFRAVIVVS